MNIVDIIIKKKNKQELTKEEIDFVIENYVNEEIKDYQMSSLLMAIVLNGMNLNETYYLTDAMLRSGEQINFDAIDNLVDKHSTGGVGDKTSLIVAPLVATTNVKVAKLSGKGLGHTGGTIDKLESIENFNVNLSEEEFIEDVNKVGMAISSSTKNLVVADKKMYALRDVTGTVQSIPLIASSIMSKKIAAGTKKIVIDLKVGNGALMKDIKSAEQLASYMIAIGKKYNAKVICVLSNMNQPLGCAVGNSLEIEEVMDVLQNKGPQDITELSLIISSLMVSLGSNMLPKEAYKLMEENLKNGNALSKFKEFVANQNGNIDSIKISDKTESITSVKDGYIKSIDTLKLGNLCRDLKAGRKTKEDIIDYTVGMKIFKKVGDYVKTGDELIKIFYNEVNIPKEEVLNCIEIGNKVEKEPLIYKIIGDLND